MMQVFKIRKEIIQWYFFERLPNKMEIEIWKEIKRYGVLSEKA